MNKLIRACTILWWCQFRYFIRWFKWILVALNLQEWTKILFVMIRDNILNAECCISFKNCLIFLLFCVLQAFLLVSSATFSMLHWSRCFCRKLYLIPSNGKMFANFISLFRFFYACPSFRWEGEWVVLYVVLPLVGDVGKLFYTWKATNIWSANFACKRVYAIHYFSVRAAGKMPAHGALVQISFGFLCKVFDSIWVYIVYGLFWRSSVRNQARKTPFGSDTAPLRVTQTCIIHGPTTPGANIK